MKYTSTSFSGNNINYAIFYYLTGESSESNKIIGELGNVLTHFYQPVSQENNEERFYNLSATWKYEKTFISSIESIVLHPAYQQIIGMGSKVLPYIFKELNNSIDHWFWALKTITGQDPVSPSDRGDMEKMKLAWMNWATTNGYFKSNK